MGCMIIWACLSSGRITGTSEDRYGHIYGECGSVTVDGVTIQSESANWIVLELYKSTIIVLSREQFIEGIRRGKGW